MTFRTLYRGRSVFSPADPTASALLVRGDRIEWIGPAADSPTADRVVDCDGAVLTPGFVDAHVHVTATGLALTGLDLTDATGADDVLDRVAAHAAGLPADAVVLGQGWDDAAWSEPAPGGGGAPVGLSPHALHRAGGGRLVYLSRVDAHSAAASSGLLALVDPGTDGYAADGLLRREAHHVVRRHAHASITTAQRRQAQRAALRHGAGRGIVAVHECSGPDIAGEDDFTELLALAAADPALPEVFGYWGETDPAKARELGAVGAGGDLFVDGSLGSHTAYLRQPYADAADGRGHAYLDARRLAEHLVACTEAGVQAGFHAVGDAAVARVLTALAVAEPRVGLARLRDLRHRVEHATVLDRALIAGLVEFGLVASVQPTFDRMWGGEHGMYARRLGPRRALDTNPIGAMRSVGVPLAFGSDSPVTAMDPWESVVAAMTHHSPTQRIGVRTAFAAHSRGGWRAVGRDDEGRLVPGAPATFAAWDCDAVSDGLPRLLPADADEPSPRKPRCRLAVRNGVDLAGPGD